MVTSDLGDLAVGDVTAHGDGPAAGGHDLLGHRLAGVRVELTDHDRRTLRRTLQRLTASDAATGAGDDDDLAIEKSHGREHDDRSVTGQRGSRHRPYRGIVSDESSFPAESKFQAMLQEQIRNEFTAAQQYTAVAVHLDDQDLPQLAAHFYAQAVEERNHAMSMVQYLLDSDTARAHPRCRRGAQRLRVGGGRRASSRSRRRRPCTGQITALARAARDEGDYLGEQFMQWFLKEQVEEVASMSTLLTVVRRAGDNLFHIEDFVARELSRSADAVDPTAPPAAGGRV